LSSPEVTSHRLDLTMPRLSDSMTEGTILKWLVGPGDEVQPGQPVVEVETDKATVTHEADQAGTVVELVADEGATVAVGAPIAVLAAPGAGPTGAPSAAPSRSPAGSPSASPAAQAPAPPPATAPAPDTGAGSGTARAKASPLARRIAARWGLELAGLPGSGPQGRVIRADVERALAGQDRGAATDGVEELTTVQRTIARRMSQARREVPDIELRRLVDMTECVNLRAGLRALSEPTPTFNDFIVKAVALALRDFPRVNSRYVDESFEHQPRISVGIAVAAEDALLVPTIFDADTKSLGQIAAESRSLAARAREGTITPAELDGATFTVSNLGMYAVDSFSAIINPPQSAILAVGSVAPRPVVDATGAVVPRQTVILTLACDHRILYGADGARFLGSVAGYLERPLALMLA